MHKYIFYNTIGYPKN